MPSISVAGGLGLNARVAVVDRKVQRDHAVTSSNVLLGVGWSISAGCISYAMPSIRIACGLVLDACVAVVNSQVKGDHAVTTGSVLLGIGRLVCAGCIGYAIDRKSVVWERVLRLV